MPKIVGASNTPFAFNQGPHFTDGGIEARKEVTQVGLDVSFWSGGAKIVSFPLVSTLQFKIVL